MVILIFLVTYSRYTINMQHFWQVTAALERLSNGNVAGVRGLELVNSTSERLNIIRPTIAGHIHLFYKCYFGMDLSVRHMFSWVLIAELGV